MKWWHYKEFLYKCMQQVINEDHLSSSMGFLREGLDQNRTPHLWIVLIILGTSQKYPLSVPIRVGLRSTYTSSYFRDQNLEQCMCASLFLEFKYTINSTSVWSKWLFFPYCMFYRPYWMKEKCAHNVLTWIRDVVRTISVS